MSIPNLVDLAQLEVPEKSGELNEGSDSSLYLSLYLSEEIFLAPKWQISNSHNFGTISNFDMRFAASCSSCLGLSKQQFSTRLKAWKTFKIEAENDDFRKMLL